ncbi:MAG: aminodeoxychorismate synthase component I [Thermodesulfobacteria bacterium]|nr:aminodeoxychorismate synthase component I [Thermodesulfobacteriota bacterium]
MWVNGYFIPYRIIEFEEPVDELRLSYLEDPKEFFSKLKNYIKEGHYAFGFFSYELGYLLEKRLNKLFVEPKGVPLAYFKVFKRVKRKSVFKKEENFQDDKFFDVKYGVSKTEYTQAIKKIKEYIANGDVYQINYTFKVKFNFNGDPLRLFWKLIFSQRCRYGAYLDGGDFFVLSLSPELFLKKRGAQVLSSPMKGTSKRGISLKHDNMIKSMLFQDEKNRAENVMIVDLIRNDLGRCCEEGSVWVKELFKVESYPTLHQMISTVTGTLKAKDFLEVLKSLFPCGSVTGAPKIRAMEIIRELEKEPRGVYTGAIGVFTPKGDYVFNVGIRTLVFWKENEHYKGEAGIGSGVVWDSSPEEEYSECLLKSRFFVRAIPYFKLIESIYFSPGKSNYLLKLHYQRMRDSAKFFRFKIPSELSTFQSFEGYLKKHLKHLNPGHYRVRIFLSPEGELELKVERFEPWKEELKVALVKRKFDMNMFFFHKTTNREPLNFWRKKAEELGFDEVVFFNDKGELLEGTISTVFLKLNGKLYTPPVNLGILRGVLREWMLKNKQVLEKVLTIDELTKAEAFYIGNSVRGLGRVTKWCILEYC